MTVLRRSQTGPMHPEFRQVTGQLVSVGDDNTYDQGRVVGVIKASLVSPPDDRVPQASQRWPTAAGESPRHAADKTLIQAQELLMQPQKPQSKLSSDL